MKPQRFILIALAAVIVGASLWWFTRPAETPEKTADVPALAKANTPKTAGPTTQIAQPLAPPVKIKSQTAKSADAPPNSSDPQADLKTAIPEIARLVRAGDWATFRETYTSPDKADPRDIQKMRDVQQQTEIDVSKDPKYGQFMQQQYEAMAESFEALENQTPIFSAAGNEATYQYATPAFSNGKMVQGVIPEAMTFVKINGKWYFGPAK